MSETRSITLVTNGDDWEGLYINGVLMIEGHQITLRDLVDALDLGVSLDQVEVTTKYLGEEVTSLPEKLSTIPERAVVS